MTFERSDNADDELLSAPGNMHDTAVAALRARIVSGRMPTGSPLEETELCDELGVSRAPLREAIRTLAREGLVRITPNRSAVVAALDVTAVRDLFQAIGQLEAQAARLACSRISDADIEQLNGMYHEMLISYHRGDLAAYIPQNGRIHRAQLELSGNDVLVEMWETLYPRAERARTAANFDPVRWGAAVSEHEAMLKALAAQDEEALAPLMAAHYDNGLTTLRRRQAPGATA